MQHNLMNAPAPRHASTAEKRLVARYVVGGVSPAYNITSMLVAGDGFSSQGIQHIAARGQE